jgi:Kef-type K+ transport system membrane component KefB
MSIGIIITGRGGINKIFDTMNQRDSSFVALCRVASLMFASQWLMKHILNHPALAKT